LDTACVLITRFAEMLTARSGQDKLEQWICDTENGPLPELRGVSTGLRKDFAAVLAGLSLPWSSGPVEGHVNRIKMLKRQMFGRAKPDLLRTRILLTT
jgi:transposase